MPIPPKLLDGFKYRIDKLKPGESAILKWPDIAAYADIFIADDIEGDCEVVMRYIILCYTPGSPAVFQHPTSIGKRKTYVCEILDIPIDEDGRYGVYNDMLLVRGEGMRRRLATYLSIQHSVEWAILCDAQTELESVIESRNPVQSDEALKRRKLIEDLRVTIEESVARLTKYDDSKAVEDSIIYFTSQRSLKIRPEERIDSLPKPTTPEKAKEGKSVL